MDVGLELKEVQVTPVALKRVVDRLVFHPTMRTRESCPRGEGAVDIDPARFGIAGHVNDLQGAGRPSARVNNDNGSMMKTSDVWPGDGSEPTGDKEGHRVGLERATLRDGKNGATQTKRKRA